MEYKTSSGKTLTRLDDIKDYYMKTVRHWLEVMGQEYDNDIDKEFVGIIAEESEKVLKYLKDIN
ncbi:MAG: hypothetical protein ACRC6E_13235 [Fusobacteriaceae bacterium]